MKKWLEKWKGGEVALWEYSVSHKSLVLRIQKKGIPGNLHVCCGDTDYIAGPTKWQNGVLTYTAIPDPNPKSENLVPLFYEIKDEIVGFYIRCCGVEVSENVKPIYTI